MVDVRVASEVSIGIIGYLTAARGVGGRLREMVDDFVVEEVLPDGSLTRVGSGLSDHAERDLPGGRYCHFVLEKRGIDLFEAIRQLSRSWGISRKAFSYSGTKDARAVTSQLVSVRGMDPATLESSSSRLSIHTPYRSDQPLRLGDHWGNSFRIVISGIEFTCAETDETIHEGLEQIAELGGAPNFYGHQRFGTLRANSHIVGRQMLSGEFGEAVWRYLCDPYRGEDPRVLAARIELAESRNIKRALEEFPKRLTYERTMLSHLDRNPSDYVGALNRFPRRLLSLLLRAYQSYIFNLALSKRLEHPDPLSPRPGDVVESGTDILSVGDAISVGEANELVKKGGRVVLPVVGYASRAEGPLSGDAVTIMEREGVKGSDFYVRQFPDISPRGGYRPVSCQVRDVHVEPAKMRRDKATVALSFKLEKGCYATSVLREFMKADIGAY